MFTRSRPTPNKINCTSYITVILYCMWCVIIIMYYCRIYECHCLINNYILPIYPHCSTICNIIIRAVYRIFAKGGRTWSMSKRGGARLFVAAGQLQGVGGFKGGARITQGGRIPPAPPKYTPALLHLGGIIVAITVLFTTF